MNKYLNISKIAALLLVATLSSCDLDINDNPNSPTGSVVTPDLILPGAVNSTASDLAAYNNYGAFTAGFQVPGKGVSGYGDQYTYNFTSTTYTALWTDVFSHLKNYTSIIATAESDSKYALYGAAAHILKVYNYELLVDNYGDVPYTEGATGTNAVSPAFDKDEDVYPALVKELDAAILTLKDGISNAGSAKTLSPDPIFSGNLTKWIQFANNIKLRLLVKATGTSIDSFAQSVFKTFSSEGFLKEDALINPGYNASSNQNPFWTTFVSSIDGTITYPARFYLPSTYLFGFYNGTKLDDSKRGTLIYVNFPNTPTAQLANETNNPATPQYAWGGKNDKASGVFKGRDAGVPVFLASETYFLLAEAALTGHVLDGDAKSNFNKGIAASFSYLEKDKNNNLPAGSDPDSDATKYIQANGLNYLANFDLALSQDQKLEAIITQKYIALNYIHSHEAWSEFRRTTYPKISGTDAKTTFVSIRSQSTHSDRLPVRLLYPSDEINLNPNTPKLTNAFSNPIFWDQN